MPAPGSIRPRRPAPGRFCSDGPDGLDERLAVPGLADPHDLAWDGELLVAVSTLDNAVFWIDAKGTWPDGGNLREPATAGT